MTGCPKCAALARPGAERCDLCGESLVSKDRASSSGDPLSADPARRTARHQGSSHQDHDRDWSEVGSSPGRPRVLPAPVLPDRKPLRVAHHVGNSRVRSEPTADGSMSAELVSAKPASSAHVPTLRTAEPVSPFAPDDSSRRDPSSCPTCGRLLLPGRRYCGCGAERTLSTVTGSDRAASDVNGRVAPAPALPTVLRRNRRFHTAMRAANNGARARFDAPLSASTRGARWAAGAVAVGLITSQVGGLGRESRHWAVTHVPFVSQLFYTGIPVHAVRQTAGHTSAAPALMYGKSPKAWTTAWHATAISDCTALKNAPAAAAITFGGVYNVDLIAVQAGLSAHDASAAAQYRPKQLDISFTDGSCESLELANTANVQRFTVPESLGRQSRGAVVAIVSAYPPATGRGTQISIRSVQFDTRRWSS